MSETDNNTSKENSVVGVVCQQLTDSSNTSTSTNSASVNVTTAYRSNFVDSTITRTVEVNNNNNNQSNEELSGTSIIMPPSVSSTKRLEQQHGHHDEGESTSDNVDGVVALLELASNEIEQIRKQQQEYNIAALSSSSSAASSSSSTIINNNNPLDNIGRTNSGSGNGILRSFHTFPTACLSILKSLEGNSRCVDCGERNPQWAAVRYGALVCLQCSGHHRSLGVQVSTIRSVTMDEWSLEEIVSMLEGGNAQLDGFFARHALTEDAVQIATERKVPSSSSSSGTTGSCNSSTSTTSSSSSNSSSQAAAATTISSSTTSTSLSSIRPSGTTTASPPTTTIINKENVIRMRYKTKAALFYRRQMELHVRNVLNAGPYRGREISRRLKHHPLDKRNSTVE